MYFLNGGVLAIRVAECTNEPSDKRMLAGARMPDMVFFFFKNPVLENIQSETPRSAVETIIKIGMPRNTANMITCDC